MKKSLLVAALSLAFASVSAFAHDGGNSNSGSISGGLVVGGVGTVGQISAAETTSSAISGTSVSATRVNGNGYSNQSTVSTGAGSVTAGINVTPTSVTSSTSQTASSHVVSTGVSTGNTPALDNQGLIVNGTTGVAQVSNTGAAVASQSITGQSGLLAVGGYAGYNAVGNIAPIAGYGGRD